jgi:hypothetical protein
MTVFGEIQFPHDIEIIDVSGKERTVCSVFI